MPGAPISGKPLPTPDAPLHNRLIRVYGLVQGVGFRPYVWQLANELQLSGWVRNDSSGVTIAVNGKKLPEFMRRLPVEIPRLARIDRLEETDYPAPLATGFVIDASQSGPVATSIGPDSAICPACIADISDPQHRR